MRLFTRSALDASDGAIWLTAPTRAAFWSAARFMKAAFGPGRVAGARGVPELEFLLALAVIASELKGGRLIPRDERLVGLRQRCLGGWNVRRGVAKLLASDTDHAGCGNHHLAV